LPEALNLVGRAAGYPVLLVDVPRVPVTLEVPGLPVEEALRALLSGYAPGLGYAELPGGLLVVAPKDRLAEFARREMRVYEGLPAGAAQVVPGAAFLDLGGGRVAVLGTPEHHRLLVQLLQEASPLVAVRSFPVRSEAALSVVKDAFPGVSAHHVKETGMLVVRGDPRTLVEVRELLESTGLYGSPSPDQNPALRVFELRYLSPEEALGLAAGLLPEALVKALQGDKNLRALYGRLSAVEAEQVRDFLRLVDRPRRQVELQVRIEQADEQRARALGLDWQVLANGFAAAVAQGAFNLSVDTAVKQALQAVANLRASEGSGLTKTLVNTRLYALDGQEVSLTSGGRLLLPQLVAAPSPGGGASGGGAAGGAGGYFAVDFGLRVKLRPVLAGEEVVLSAQVGLGGTPTSGPAGGVSIPSQDVQATLRLRPGDTAVLGGVVSTVKNESTQGMPLLSWIPLLGELFKSRQASDSSSVVLVFVSAKPVEP
jgi:type II secretory pathway component GspD/PulD (secretin)